jgi:hypothetical protein
VPELTGQLTTVKISIPSNRLSIRIHMLGEYDWCTDISLVVSAY